MDKKLYDLQGVMALGAKDRRAPHRCWVRRLVEVIVLANATFLLGPFLMAQRPSRPARQLPTSATTLAPGEQPPRYKAIWEPVNYGQDVNLTDVYFVTADVGYVSGAAGTILKTTDGGRTWNPQLGGDPQSQEPKIDHLRFVDARHGWALQWASGGVKLLRTTDGENWEQAGNPPQQFGLIEYQFVSPSVGLLLDANANGSRIYRSSDGGRTWKETFPQDACRFNAEVQGLPHQVGCALITLAVASPTVAYAVGFVWADLPDVFVDAKTQDGGVTWGLAVMHGPSNVFDYAGRQWQRLFFLDSQNGLLATAADRLYATGDGGASWHGVAGAAGPQIRFADPEVGWAFRDLNSGLDYVLRYTSDGGKRWLSRSLHFPAEVVAFTLPQRNAGYVVGNHGMVYRYRIVPIDYKVANMIDAPTMPGYNLLPIQADLQNVRLRIQSLQAKLQAIQAQTGNQVSGSQATSAPAPASSTEAAQNTTVAQADTSAQTTAAGGFPQDASAGGAFTQDTLVAGGFTQSTADSGPPAQPSGPDAGFVQDSGPSSSFIQSCCAADVQGLQNSMGLFTQNVSMVSTKYRPLNLILAGMNLFTDLVTKAQNLRTSYRSLRSAHDSQAALAVLSQLSASVDDMARTATYRFQGYPGMAPQAPSPGPFQQQP